jgi:flavodoxin
MPMIRDGNPITLTRSSFLRGAVAGVAGVTLGAGISGCSGSSPGSREGDREHAQVGSIPSASNVLLAYFSRAGENYYYGGRTNLKVGNTEVLSGMISKLIGCDVHRIEAVDPYPDDYSETVERNVREQDTDARPVIANPWGSIDRYDVVLLGSPIWNVRAPMILSTFAESYDFTGKTIFPLTTYAMSGLGTTPEDYAASCPGATIGEGLAVRGEQVRDADAAVESWLRRIGLLNS